MRTLLAILVLAVGLALIWGLGWFFGLALVVKWILTVMLVSAVGIVLAVAYILRVRAASRLERSLAVPSKKEANAGAERRTAIRAAQKRAEEAIAALKATRVGRTGLYTLPWYVIVGPPGVGKTTAIRHSGIEFPLERAGVASRFRGAGGTKDCDWWFANDAIMLDTAGRFMSAGDDEEWLAFLDLVRKFRPRKPINGVVVTVSVEDLLAAKPDDVEQLVARLRARMNELASRLKVLVPVYVLFTKLDRVAGFAEFWASLSSAERGQPWGFTVPLGSASPELVLEREFDVLEQVLRSRTVRRLASEGQVRTRRTLWTFPVEFARLRKACASVAGELFRSNAYQELPMLRGVYFTSGTQDTAASSQVMASIASVLGLKVPARIAEKVEPRSYFLGEVFRRVIFPDRELARRTDHAANRDRALRASVTALLLLASVTLLLPACVSSSRNRALAATTTAIGVDLHTARDPRQEFAQRTAPLERARQKLEELAAWRAEGAPVQYRWGMYAGDQLYEGLRDEYVASVTELAIDPVRSELESRLHALDAQPVHSREAFNADFDLLKMYRMLGEPAHVDAAWAAPRMVRVWSEVTHRSAEDAARLLPHVRYLLELEARGETSPRPPLDAALVERTRSALAQVPRLERAYDSLVRDANVEIASIRKDTIFYGSIGPFVLSRRGIEVGGAYTKQGWLRVRALLGQERSKLAAEQWVLGDTSDGSPDETIDKLRDLYFSRYRAAWRDFLEDLRVQDPGNAQYALEEVNALSEPEWPYLRLIQVLRDNITLDVEDPGALSKVVETAKQVLDGGSLAPPPRKASPVEEAFAPIVRFGVPATAVKEGEASPPTSLSQYEAVLSDIVGALTELRDSDSGSDPRKMAEVFQKAYRSTTALLQTQDGFTRPLLSPLLMNPIRLAWNRVVRDAGASAGASWESSVWQTWHDKLEGRYPFAATTTEASVEDVVDFFAPSGGVLWSFYDESLRPTLDRNGTTFVPARRFKSAIGYTSEFLDGCLKRGAQITSAIFAPKSDHASVEFTVNLHSVSSSIGEVTIEVDGVSHVYRNEPEQWVTITWPGKTAHGARLQVRGAGGLDEEIDRPGDFGLFRLLDIADVQPGSAAGRGDGTPTIVATWALSAAHDGASVSLDLRPVRAESPLSTGYFKDFACPRAITAQ